MENNIDPKVESSSDPGISSELKTENQETKNPQKKPNKFINYIKNHKKPVIFITVIVLLLVIGGITWVIYRQPTPTDNTPAKITTDNTDKPVVPATVADALTGLQVSPDAASKPVVGVMIENSYPDARPQSGLSQAGAVYEALAEGGITRFLAVFQEPLPTSIGPVRSLRPYYLRWGLEYNIPVAHAGGSQPALSDISKLGMKNIDALAYDGSTFYRTSDKEAPHNLYTNDAKLSALVAKLGFANAPTFTPLTRKADAPMATPTHTKIDISYGMASYNVQWQYDATTNSYLRFQGGTAQKDRNNGNQITSKNVVVEFTPTGYSTQSNGKPETDINLVGSGKALIFEDGDLINATWNKSSNNAQTTFTDSTGAAVKFNAGNTWYQVIPVGNTVTD